MNEQEQAIKLILTERDKQDKKWGVQNHWRSKWYLIAQEEMGEIAQEMLRDYQRESFREELIQAAAVLLAWLECEIRNGPE